ncbi:MAG: beta-N-acetylhexosaminidase [Clostridiales bacterium]|nr:beta-N-acetylhexosaminidase [Clostridiales bacterium]
MIKLVPQVDEIKIIGEEKFAFTHISLGKNMLSQNAIDDFVSFCRLPSGDENIVFANDNSLCDGEYILQTGEIVTITAGDESGQFYALQTLKQIFFQSDFNVVSLEVRDKPVCTVRGFMLDVGRYFFSVDDVKTIIRRMAYHKLNLFHFHLTEDQGWRIEIKKYPLLTSKGSIRRRTNFNRTAYGGFYTQKEIKEIVDYAHSFCIKVMPEFDVPGHSRAAIACYPKLSCFERELPVADHWGVKHDVLCAGKASTMEFVKGVLDELFEMLPDEYIHIGGDEVPKHRWNLCPECNKKMSELGLKNADELQAWFMNTVKDYCASHGKKAFMWSWDFDAVDLLDNDLGITNCSDNSCNDREFIDASASACYIDLPYGRISLDDTIRHKIPSGKCLGIETTLWTEFVPDMHKADMMTYPRLGAVCEIGWNGECPQDFIKKLDFYYSYLSRCGCESSPLVTANPSKIRGAAQNIWFERRQLTWQGLTNIIDDKKTEKLAKKV